VRQRRALANCGLQQTKPRSARLRSLGLVRWPDREGTRVIDLTERIREHIRIMFAPSDVDTAQRVLISQCNSNLPGLGSSSPDHLERIRSAVIRVSAGHLAGLSEAIHLAELDWRDLLMAAGFAEDPSAHMRWEPRAFSTEISDHWLAGTSLPGVAFSQNDPVIVTTPTDALPGSVISLEALEPEPRYLVKLGSGAHLMAFQWQLKRID
jgi:hypothetical protein